MNKAQENFANEMIKHGNAIKAYRKAYPTCKTNQAAKVNANRLLKNASIQLKIKVGGEKVSRIAEGEAIQVAKEEYKGLLLSALEKRTILAEIATGAARVPHVYFDTDTNQMETFMREPNAIERIKAIETDNKMTGDNAPVKQEIVNKDKQRPVITLPDGTILEI